LTARAKSLLHTSKKEKKKLNCHGVTVTMSDMNTVQKIQEEKIFNETIYYRDKPKTGQKWPNFTKWPNTFFMPNVFKK